MKIVYNNSEKMQTLKGFGTSSCWWSPFCKGKYADELAELLYGDSGLKLNIYRYNVGAGYDEGNYRVTNPWRRSESLYEFDREKEEGQYNYSNDRTAREFMKKCLAKGNIDTVVLFANSPHWSQTSTGQASGSLLYHTCNLPKMNYKKFVGYLLDITEFFINDGVPVTYISPINEPQWKWGGSYVWQEGCHYETEELVEVYHLFAEEIIKRELPVRLYGPESGEMFGLTPEYLEAFKKDETIMKVLPVFAYHSYHDDNNPEARIKFKNELVNKNPSLRFDMSEWCELPNKSPTDSIKAALITARIIGQDLIMAGAESWTSWVAVNQFSIKDDGKDYSDGFFSADDSFTKLQMAKRYFGMAHFSKFIPKGSVCLDTGNPPENENTLNVFSFLIPEGKTVSVIVNEGDTQSVEFEGEFEKMQIICSSDEKQLDCVYDGKFKTAFEIAANSLATVILG